MRRCSAAYCFTSCSSETLTPECTGAESRGHLCPIGGRSAVFENGFFTCPELHSVGFAACRCKQYHFGMAFQEQHHSHIGSQANCTPRSCQFNGEAGDASPRVTACSFTTFPTADFAQQTGLFPTACIRKSLFVQQLQTATSG